MLGNPFAGIGTATQVFRAHGIPDPGVTSDLGRGIIEFVPSFYAQMAAVLLSHC